LKKNTNSEATKPPDNKQDGVNGTTTILIPGKGGNDIRITSTNETAQGSRQRTASEPPQTSDQAKKAAKERDAAKKEKEDAKPKGKPTFPKRDEYEQTWKIREQDWQGACFQPLGAMQERLLEWLKTKSAETGNRTPVIFKAVIQVQSDEDVEEKKNYIGSLSNGTNIGDTAKFTVIHKISSAAALAMQSKKDTNAEGAWQISSTTAYGRGTAGGLIRAIWAQIYVWKSHRDSPSHLLVTKPQTEVIAADETDFVNVGTYAIMFQLDPVYKRFTSPRPGDTTRLVGQWLLNVLPKSEHLKIRDS
jgi:hypothetical protein